MTYWWTCGWRMSATWSNSESPPLSMQRQLSPECDEMKDRRKDLLLLSTIRITLCVRVCWSVTDPPQNDKSVLALWYYKEKTKQYGAQKKWLSSKIALFLLFSESRFCSLPPPFFGFSVLLTIERQLIVVSTMNVQNKQITRNCLATERNVKYLLMLGINRKNAWVVGEPPDFVILIADLCSCVFECVRALMFARMNEFFLLMETCLMPKTTKCHLALLQFIFFTGWTMGNGSAVFRLNAPVNSC